MAGGPSRRAGRARRGEARPAPRRHFGEGPQAGGQASAREQRASGGRSGTPGLGLRAFGSEGAFFVGSRAETTRLGVRYGGGGLYV